jgi:hypothetical protein
VALTPTYSAPINGGTFAVQDNGSATLTGSIGGSPTFIIPNSGASLTIDGTINNNQTINVQNSGGQLTINSSISGGNTTVVLQGSGTTTDTSTISNGVFTIAGSNTVTLKGTNSTVSNGSFTVQDYATLIIQDPVSNGSFKITDYGKLEFVSSEQGGVTFASGTDTTKNLGTLILDDPANFSGKISGFTGGGATSTSDKIDLPGYDWSSFHLSYSGGKLTFYDGTHGTQTNPISITINSPTGSYAATSYTSNGVTGVVIYDPPASTLTATETAGKQINLGSVTVDPGSVVALNVAVSGADGSGNDATSVTLSGLPSDIILTNAAGDALHAANGSISLTQPELAGLALHTSSENELITLIVNAANSADGWTATKSLVIDASAPATHWQSAASGDWASAASWTASGTGGPTSSEAAVIDASGAYTVSIDGAAVAHSLTVNAAGATVVDSGSLTLGGALTVDAGTFELDNGNLQAASIAIAAAGTFLIEHGNIALAQPITNDGSWVVENNNTVVDVVGAVSGSGALTVGAGATLEFGTVPHTIAGPLNDQGTVEVTDGKLEIAGTATGTGVLKIDAGATLQLDGADSVNVTFAGSTGELILKDPAHFTGTVAGATGSLTTGDKIDLTNIAYSNNDAYTLSYDKAANITTLKVTDGSTTDTIKLAGDQTAATWTFSSDGHGGTIAVDPPASTVTGNHDSAQLPGQASWHDADHFNFSTDSAADHLASHTDHDVRPGATSFASDPAALGRHGEDQFVFNANFGHDGTNEFHAGNDATHSAQPSWQGVAEILTHAAEADHGATLAHDQGHAFDWSHWQKDKAPTDFIVHG